MKSQINVSSVSGGIELGKTKCTYSRFNRKSSKPYISKDAVSWRQRQCHHHLCRISSFLNNIYQILTPPPTSTLRPTLRSTCHLKICLHSSLIFTSKQIIPFVLFRLMFCRPSQYWLLSRWSNEKWWKYTLSSHGCDYISECEKSWHVDASAERVCLVNVVVVGGGGGVDSSLLGLWRLLKAVFI